MPSDLILEVLVKARALIAEPTRWCQGSFALDDKGRRCSSRNVAATKWCSVGAINHVCDSFGPAEFLDAEAVKMEFANSEDVNDQGTHADVLMMFDRAIAARRLSLKAKP